MILRNKIGEIPAGAALVAVRIASADSRLRIEGQFVGLHMSKQAGQGCRIAAVDRLSEETDVASHNARRRAANTWRFLRNPEQELVQPHRRPAKQVKNDSSITIFSASRAKDAFGRSAVNWVWNRLRLGDVVLDMVGTPSDRGRRV